MDNDQAVGEHKSVIHENAIHPQSAQSGNSQPKGSGQDHGQSSQEHQDGAQQSEKCRDAMGL
jgi:hypothetical protein